MSIKTLRFGLSLFQKCGVLQGRFFHRTSIGMEKSIGKYPTIRQLAQELADVMGVEIGYKTVPKSRDHLQPLIPQSVDELPPRTMRDSFTIGIIPLGSDAVLQEKYVSLTGQVRISRFLEDMDLFSVVVAQKFLLNPRVKPGMNSPYTIVTALVDRIEFTGYTPKLTQDVRISGHVSWVGITSVEVIAWLDQSSHGDYHRIIKACFVLACRNSINSKSAIINKLVPENEQEKAIMRGGERRKQLRLDLGKQDLSRNLPTREEQEIIHDLYLRSQPKTAMGLYKPVLPQGCAWMEDCVLSNIIHAFPQNRNFNNTVFGGFLMRMAFQLTFTLGLIFSKFQPIIRSISDLQFRYPVYMTSLLRMHAFIVYTEGNIMQIMLMAETWDLSQDSRVHTNTFHFTYEVPEALPEIFPKTYSEAMRYIDGRRHFTMIGQEQPEGFEPITTYGEPKYSSLTNNK